MLARILSFSGLAGKELARNAEDPGLIPGSGRSPGKGNGHTLQYPCLGNPMDSIPGLGRSLGERNGYPLQYSGVENSMYRGAW